MPSLPRRVLFGGLACAALAACSPAATDYRLAVQPGPVLSQVALAVVVRGVSIPGYLDQDGIPKSGGNFQFASFPNDVWAEPLADMLQGVMVQDLSQRLPGAVVLADGGAIAPPNGVAVEMNVLRFDPGADGQINFTLQIALRQQPDNRLLKSVNFTRTMALAGSGPVGIVAAMSALWAQAADEVAAILVNAAASG